MVLADTVANTPNKPPGAGKEPTSLALSIPENANWYVLQITPNRDELACKHLELNGIPSYSPTCTPFGAAREQRLLPGYVFASLRMPEDFGAVQANPYALWILGAGRSPIPVPDAEVHWIRQMAAQRSAEPYGGAAEGDWVRVRHGPMVGIEGRVVRTRGALRLAVEVTILGRGVSVEIDRRDCELLRRRP